MPPPETGTRQGVLITRPAEASDALAQAVTGLGYQPVINPLLEIVPIPFTLPGDPFEAVLLTSTAAVRPIVNLVDRRTPVLTVGEITRAEAMGAGFSDVRCVGPTVHDAVKVLAESDEYRALTLLYPSGMHISADPATLLGGAGPRIMRVPVYDARALPLEKNIIALLNTGYIGWILLLSRRTAEALAMAIDDMEQKGWIAGTGLVCLSARTAEPLNSLPWRSIAIAAQPTVDSLIASLSKDFS